MAEDMHHQRGTDVGTSENRLARRQAISGSLSGCSQPALVSVETLGVATTQSAGR